MSQEYLNRLLSTPENRVQGECVICLEPYNTLNTTTGVIKAEVRLSCGHRVGSACIVTWLRDNNSCPLCRETFFPWQPRPYLEHGLMDIGRESTGRINATGSLTREPDVIRSVTVPASSELDPPADSRSRIFDAGRQKRVRLPTGSEMPRSSPIGGSGLGRSSTFRDTTGSEVLAGSDTRNSNAGRSNTVRVPTGSVGASTVSEALTDSFFRRLGDLDVGRSTTDTGLRTDDSRRKPVASTTSHTRNSGFDRLRIVGLPTEPAMLADRVARNLGGMWGEPLSTIVDVAESLAARMPVRLQSQNSYYVGAVCLYMASHILHRSKSAQEVAGSTSLSPDRIRSVYELVYSIRPQLIDAKTLGLIAGNHLEGVIALLPPPDGENVIIDNEEQWLRELQSQNTSPQQLPFETCQLCFNLYGYLCGPSTYYICIEICESGVLERRLGLRSPRLEVVIGLYMATNLLGLQVPCQRIADLVGINEYTLRATYVVRSQPRIHPWADQFLQPRMLRHIGREKMPRALEAVPALNWPLLEV